MTGEEDVGVDAVTLLGRLLSSKKERAQFADAPEAWLERANATAAAHAELATISPSGLGAQADVLLSKRWAEIADHIPKTVRALGAKGPRLFEHFAENAPWPRGYLRHLEDALAFIDFLNRNEPHCVSGVEEANLRGHLAFRKDRKRVTSTFVAHKDMGPVAGYAVVWHWGAMTWHAFVPTPIPAAFVRWQRGMQRRASNARAPRASD